MQIKLLVLPRYNRLGASSRLRMMQYLPSLESAGFEVTVVPLFSDAYVSSLQAGSRNLTEVLKAYVGRVNVLLDSNSFDLIWIEKELLPWLPAWVERALISSCVPYVLDYDDAVFHYYDQSCNFAVRRLLGTKHPTLIRSATMVVAGNGYLGDFVKQVGAKRVEIVPTVIDLERYPLDDSRSINGDGLLPLVGWIGQRATASLLVPYKDLFEYFLSTGKARFAAIGIDTRSLGLCMESVPWMEQTEVGSIMSFDIGIMPLVDEPFERGKCGYKLVQYMACSLPIIASPVGVNRQIVEHGVNGFLAETPEQWTQALRTLLADADLRKRMGMAGRRKVEQQYCLQVTAPKLVALLKEAALGKLNI